MKKNDISHMTAPKGTKRSLFRRLDILPGFVCLILALLIWLTVVNVMDRWEEAPSATPEATLETIV